MSIELANPVTATIWVLNANPAIIERGVEGVDGGDVAQEAIATMPHRRCVVAAAGGGGTRPGSADYVPASVRRVDVRCYGETPLDADTVALGVVYALKDWKPGLAGRALVHWFKHSSGPVSMKDPDAAWPVTIVSFQVMLADVLV